MIYIYIPSYSARMWWEGQGLPWISEKLARLSAEALRRLSRRSAGPCRHGTAVTVPSPGKTVAESFATE